MSYSTRVFRFMAQLQQIYTEVGCEWGGIVCVFHMRGGAFTDNK